MNNILNFDRYLTLSTIIKDELLTIYNLDNINFSIDFSKNSENFIYKSCLCFLLAKIEQKSPLFIAQEIANNFNRSNLKKYFQIRISDNGWLEFVILDRLLNQWLNQIKNIKFPLQEIKKKRMIK
ncbi:hypothetical protein [Geminocystis sp. NIES-3709]|uniref:hypothetical protein n=1 Tax=Geminocystis sp. NIES-3709 TaxID=1617448 RepID=UPI0005FCC55D|nr:hypothetical protein [Geminocystis sp. NIES-3709]BAQ65701.1 hypothetical protein GM3709_2466 [Geminocystis sp. NIES-3709]